ncbi:MAG: methyltransferase domain-containing protein [Deltaproteobacteria bacterium]|nr:MAG: methyltransferase domain-containing protein [Deltaproteobacteria bacterium]
MFRRLVFDLGAAGYDFLTDHTLWREQVARVLDHAPAGVRAVLDLGCGPGVSTFVLAERLPDAAEVVGIDFSGEMIRRARRHHLRRHAELRHLRFLEADVTDLPFDAGRFDLAVGHSFLYLLPEKERALREIRRVLRPGGHLVLMEPNAEGSLLRAALALPARRERLLRAPLAAPRLGTSMLLWRLASGAAGRLSEGRVRQLFEASGFEAIEVLPTLAGLGLHCIGRRPAA